MSKSWTSTHEEARVQITNGMRPEHPVQSGPAVPTRHFVPHTSVQSLALSVSNRVPFKGNAPRANRCHARFRSRVLHRT